MVGNDIVIGKSTILARRFAFNGCWEVEKPQPIALSRLLTMAYGKRISINDGLLKQFTSAFAALPRSSREVEQILSTLPAPLGEAEEQVAEAHRLLKDGVSPYKLDAAMRGQKYGLRPAPDWAERLTLCDKGLVLGKGTVILPLTDDGLELEGRETQVLALLSIARRGLAPAEILEKLAAVTRALAKGETSVAAIALSQLHQPPLIDWALGKSLNLAAVRMRRGASPLEVLQKAGFGRAALEKAYGHTEAWRKSNSNHVPAGCPEGGQFCSANAGYDPTYGGALPKPVLPPKTAPYASVEAYLTHNPDIPDYKAAVVNKEDFHRFNRAANESPKQTDTQTYCFRQTFAAEGGMTKNKGNDVVAGITQDTLDAAIGDGKVPEKTTMRNMTPEQAATLYRYQVDYCLGRVGGSAALDGVGDKQAAAALCDTLFQFGDNGGADVIRRAVDAVTGKPSEETGRLGKTYYEKFCQLAQNPQTRQALSDALVAQRTARARKVNGDEIDYDRIQHFKFR